MDAYLDEQLEPEPLEPLNDSSDEEDIDLTDIPPASVPVVKQIAQRVQEQSKRLLHSFEVQMWRQSAEKEGVHVSFANDTVTLTQTSDPKPVCRRQGPTDRIYIEESTKCSRRSTIEHQDIPVAGADDILIFEGLLADGFR